MFGVILCSAVPFPRDEWIKVVPKRKTDLDAATVV